MLVLLIFLVCLDFPRSDEELLFENTSQYNTTVPKGYEDMIIDPIIPENKPKSSEDRITEWFHKMQTQSHSDVRPNFGNRSEEVEITIILSNIHDISDSEMTYSLDMYMNEAWIDDRLQFDSSIFQGTHMTLNQKAIDYLWVPDTYFINAVVASQVSQESVSHRYGIRLHENGYVEISKRVSAKFECHMDLVMYPFDYQRCYVKLTSYMHEKSAIHYKWREPDALVMEAVQKLPNFELSEHRKYEKTLHFNGREYSSLEVCFLFARNAGFCYMQLIIPAASVVLSSWVSLWLENEAQVNDLLTTLLAIIFLSYSYNSMMPRISYVKAMDIYLLACFAFIFLCLAKLILVKYLKGNAEQKEKDMMTVDALYAKQDEDFEEDLSPDTGEAEQGERHQADAYQVPPLLPHNSTGIPNCPTSIVWRILCVFLSYLSDFGFEARVLEKNKTKT